MKIRVLVMMVPVLVACTTGGQGAKQTTRPDDGNFAALLSQFVPVADAEKILGMRLVIPTYITKGLERPQEAKLLDDGSNAVGGELDFQLYGAIPQSEAILAGFSLSEWKRASYANIEAGERVDVGTTAVFIRHLPDLLDGAFLSVAWQSQGRGFEIAALGLKGISPQDVRAEALKITQSMINQ